MEVELQYHYTGAAPPVVPTELAGLTLGCSRVVGIVDTYFDTEDLGLRAAGCSLRVRVADDEATARLTWKGPSKPHGRSGKKRVEVEVLIDSVPGDGDEIARVLRDSELWDDVREAAGLAGDCRLHVIGTLRNRRSIHVYAHGLHELELSWDRLEYPVGPPETRLEVEVKSDHAQDSLDRAGAELRKLLGAALAPPERGKVRELCGRLYPQIVES